MFGAYDTEQITVYSEAEERQESHGDYLLPRRCCDPGQPTQVRSSCRFHDECTEDFKEIHRKLFLGEPFQVVDTDSWTPMTTEVILELAVETLKAMKSLELLIKMNPHLDYSEKNVYAALTCVRMFIQLNYTGPDVSSVKMKQLLIELEQLSQFEFPTDIKNLLEVDGIDVDDSIQLPVLLVLASYFLTSLDSHPGAWPFFLLWKFRIEFLHQQILTRKSWSISRRLKYLAEKFINWTRHCNHKMDGALADVHGAFLCETAEMLVYYYDGILSENVLKHAMKVLELSVAFSGKMGVRTKFQQTPMPQMVLNVTLEPDTEIVRVYPSAENSIPKSEALNDDTRLERLTLLEEDYNQAYKDVHQLVLLGLMHHKRGFHGDSDLRRQEEDALINTVIDCPVNWSGRISALVNRCQLEKRDRRAVDRSLRQIEEISKIVNRRVEASDDVFRQYLFFGCGHPQKDKIKIIFGEVLLSLEHWKEALSIYTELEAFEQIVRCYQMMNLRHKAEELVIEKIESEEKTPKLLVLLGDVTSEISYYEEAWTLSSGKSVNSQMRLGTIYFNRQEFNLAITHLKRVVELAPLEYPYWLKLAWACYKIEDYENAFQAYLHAANLEFDNFQVWNNLGNCALKTNKKDYALRAYKLAVKCSYDEWRVWSNILIVASELNILSDSLQAYHRILDLNKSFIDEASLEKMIYIGVKTTKPNTTTLSSLAKLLGRITATSSRSAFVWLLYGRVLASYMDCEEKDAEKAVKCSNFERAMHYYDKSLTLMQQNPGWRTDLIALKNVVKCISEFRENRERGRGLFNEEPNDRLKGLDHMLRQTGLSVYENLKKVIAEVPVANEELQTIFNAMTEEIKKPFFA